MPRPGFDDYGAELDKEARIWSTYVKEAEQWDEEMVDGWNRLVHLNSDVNLYLPDPRSLDVILGERLDLCFGQSIF